MDGKHILPDKGYTYGIMLTAAIAVLTLICTLFLENKFVVCVKGKKVNWKNSEEEEREDFNETTTLIKLKKVSSFKHGQKHLSIR